MTPCLETSPYEGLKPKTPVYAAGSLTDPPVSVPSALIGNVSLSSRNDYRRPTYAQHCSVATASALPPELPPTENGSPEPAFNLYTGPNVEFVE